MKKIIFLISFTALLSAAKAQTLDEVKTLMYYEKLQTAKAGLDKLLAAAPNDANVIYQLSQWHLKVDDIKGAEKLLNSKLSQSNNDLLIKAGLAHVASARGDFKQAKSIATDVMGVAKQTDWPIILAIGKACGDLSAKQTDDATALGFFGYSLLDKVTKTFTPKKYDAAMFIPLGDCLVRTNQGGKAVNEYEKALGFNPNFAEAHYRSGILFGTVGNLNARNVSFEKAIMVDPKFSSVYKFRFFEAKKANNYAEAKDNYSKYAALTETSPEIESYTCDLIFLSKDYNSCISCVDNLINKQGSSASPRLYAVKAYAYDLLGDSINAAKSMDEYFSKEKQENINLANFTKKASILAKFPNRQAEAYAAFDDAINKDTTSTGKLNTAITAASLATKYKNSDMALKYYELVYQLKGDKINNIDIYNIANIYNSKKNYAKADEYYTIYTTKFPTDIYGYAQRAYIARALDSTQKGNAKPQMDALLNLAMADTAKNKAYINLAYSYFANVATKATKYEEAAGWYEKMLIYNPGDEGIMSNIKLLRSAGKPQRPAPAPAPKTTGTTTPKGTGTTTAPKPVGTGAKPATGTVPKPPTPKTAVAPKTKG